MQVREVMTTKIITVKEDQTRQQAARLLSQHHISGLPVVNDDGLLLGIVTEYDVLSKKGQRVSDLMTRGVISVTADADLEMVSQIFVQERIRRLPVLDEGRLVGIVSRADLVREVATRWMCNVCGEVIHSEEQPEHCPRCDSVEIISWTESLPPGS